MLKGILGVALEALIMEMEDFNLHIQIQHEILHQNMDLVAK